MIHPSLSLMPKQNHIAVSSHYAPLDALRYNRRIMFGELCHLKTDLPHCRCWNSPTGLDADLHKGLWVRVLEPFDETHCLVQAATLRDSNDDPRLYVGGIPLADGTKGFKFIIANSRLQTALEGAMDFPKKNFFHTAPRPPAEPIPMPAAEEEEFLDSISKPGRA